MKANKRYYYALIFCRNALMNAEVDISMRTETIKEARSRYQLSEPQVRRLVAQLRKEMA